MRKAVLRLTGVLALVLAPHAALASECRPGPGALGVSRVVEIDTTGGPQFGQVQYRDNDFLADGEVVLTFDDGPMRVHTTRVLAALDRHCTKATFFVVGSMALSDPVTLRETASRGHTIGTHTWSHRYQLRKVSLARATQEIELGFSAVQRALGEPVAPFFRFPFLSDQQGALQHLTSRNIGVFSIDIDSIDYRARGAGGAEEVYRRVVRELTARRKGILLFHDIQPSTAAALPRILDYLKERGFRVVHIRPKQPVMTLAEYDRIADQEAGRRHLAQLERPLVSKSVTWPMAAPLPWQAQTAPAAAQPASAPVPTAPVPRRNNDDDDWRRRVFNN